MEILRLEKISYDLNALFSFELLKEVLIKLARNQNKLEDEIKNIKSSNSKRDKKISKLYHLVQNTNNYYQNEDESNDEYDENQNSQNEENEEIEKDNSFEPQDNEKIEQKKNKEYIQEKQGTEPKNEVTEKKNINPDVEKRNVNQIDDGAENPINIESTNKSRGQGENGINQEGEDQKTGTGKITKSNLAPTQNTDFDIKIESNQGRNEVRNEVRQPNITEEIKKDGKSDDREQNQEGGIKKGEKSDDRKQTKVEEIKKYEKSDDRKQIIAEEMKKDEKNDGEKDILTSKNNGKNNLDLPSNKRIKQTKNKNDVNISKEAFNQFMKQLKEMELKILSSSKTIKNMDDKLHNQLLDNNSKLDLMKEKIDELTQKNNDNEKKLEDLQVKTSELDVFSLIKDSGDGTIDGAKVLVKGLEEKIFKKFELIDKRNKIDAQENQKIKNAVETLVPRMDQFQRDIEKVKDSENQLQEEFNQYKKEIDEMNIDNKANIDNEINTKTDEVKEDFNKKLKEKTNYLENKINEIKNNSGDNFDILKLASGNNEINKEIIDDLEKKIGNIRKKINDIDNTLKIYMAKDETDSIKNDIKEVKTILEKKIGKDDLKELYNFHLNTVDEINDMKDQHSMTHDETKKNSKDILGILQKIEILTGNLSLLQNNPRQGGGPVVDLTRYVENQKLTDTLRPILKVIEKISKEIDSIRRDTSAMDEDNKLNIKNKFSRLEEDINNKINDIKNNLKKYLEKTEFNKTIKALEIQIKSITDEPKKEADSWLLAKRPLKCFNCASCEANIKNENSSNDYLPWKKYPRGEKIHRMGQGFSHMLQMMTSEFVKSIEKNEFPQEFDLISKNIKMSQNPVNEKSTAAMYINNKEVINDNLPKNPKIPKFKLPKMKYINNRLKFKKFDDSLPLSDEENNYEVFNQEPEIKNNLLSPKIVKITKKKDKLVVNGSLKTMPNHPKNIEFTDNNNV